MKAKELIGILSALGEDKTVVIEDNQGNYYDVFSKNIDKSEQVIRVLVDIDPAGPLPL